MKKILIADDEPDVVGMLTMRLRAHGYEVVTACDGIQAIVYAKREMPDLILLDIKMPGRDGYFVLESLRMSAKTALIPIIFLSALPPGDVEKKATELGAEGYFTKPYESEEIITAIREMIGG
ncbi:MAG: response regulator [Anaerolineae bacterium]|nr:response regulator [Anaerolineae bacterium]